MLERTEFQLNFIKPFGITLISPILIYFVASINVPMLRPYLYIIKERVNNVNCPAPSFETRKYNLHNS